MKKVSIIRNMNYDIFFTSSPVRPNKKTSVFRVTGLKILGRVSTYFNYFLSGKKYNFMHFERHIAFQNA